MAHQGAWGAPAAPPVNPSPVRSPCLPLLSPPRRSARSYYADLRLQSLQALPWGSSANDVQVNIKVRGDRDGEECLPMAWELLSFFTDVELEALQRARMTCRFLPSAGADPGTVAAWRFFRGLVVVTTTSGKRRGGLVSSRRPRQPGHITVHRDETSPSAETCPAQPCLRPSSRNSHLHFSLVVRCRWMTVFTHPVPPSRRLSPIPQEPAHAARLPAAAPAAAPQRGAVPLAPIRRNSIRQGCRHPDPLARAPPGASGPAVPRRVLHRAPLWPAHVDPLRPSALGCDLFPCFLQAQQNCMQDANPPPPSLHGGMCLEGRGRIAAVWCPEQR